jgi:hypothetical protein
VTSFGTPQTARETLECSRVHLGARETSLGVPATMLGIHRITVGQSTKTIFLANTAGAPGNRSYYSSFNDF